MLENQKELLEKVRNGDAAGITELLRVFGMDVNFRYVDENNEGITPLLLAIQTERPEIVKVLLRAGATSIQEHYHYYCEWRDAHVLTNLPLMFAAKKGLTEIVKMLIGTSLAIEHINIPFDGKSTNCCQEEYWEYISEDTPLIVAAREGHKEIVEILLHAGLTAEQIQHVNEESKTALDVTFSHEIKGLIQNHLDKLM